MSAAELRRLEQVLTDLKSDSAKQTEALVKKLDELSSQFQNLRVDMPDRFVQRREYNERMAAFGEDTIRNRRDMADRERDRHKELDDRLGKLEAANEWLWRLLAGAIVTGAVAVFWQIVTHGGIKLGS